MADIAFIFHWTPADMTGMRAGEILAWQDRALQRFRQAYGGSE